MTILFMAVLEGVAEQLKGEHLGGATEQLEGGVEQTHRQLPSDPTSGHFPNKVTGANQPIGLWRQLG